MSDEKPQYTVYEADLTDFLPDAENSNAGTERGTYMLRRSAEKFGAARSMVADGNGRMVAGNHIQEALVDTGQTKAIVIRHRGDVAVIVEREDWDIEDPAGAAREYALADNITSLVNFKLDPRTTVEHVSNGLNLGDWRSSNERKAIIIAASKDAAKEPPTDFPEYTEDMETDHRCPSCGYEWNGRAK